MPKVLIFAPCEKIIISQDNVVSLVSMFQDIKVTLPSDKPVPQHAVFPMKWEVFTLWQRNEQESGKEFEEKCTLLSEDGNALVTVSIKFVLTETFNRIVMQFLGFPLVKGRCLLKAWLRETGGQSDWNEIAEYPLSITYES